MSSNLKCKTDVLERENLMLREEKEKLKADLDYVCMITDVEIPEEEEHESFTEV